MQQGPLARSLLQRHVVLRVGGGGGSAGRWLCVLTSLRSEVARTAISPPPPRHGNGTGEKNGAASPRCVRAALRSRLHSHLPAAASARAKGLTLAVGPCCARIYMRA